MYKEVAKELGIAFATVRTHVHNIYKKLHVKSKAAAVEPLRNGTLRSGR